MKTAVYLRNLNRIEQQRKFFQNIRQMEKKIKGGSTNRVIVTNEIGEVVEYNKKNDMRKVIMESNEKNSIKQKVVVNY